MLFLAVLPALRAQEAAEQGFETPIYIDNQEKEYKFYPGGKISISMGAPGSLKIIGWNRSSVRMEAEIKVHSLPEEKAGAILEKSPIRVRYTDTTSTIQVAQPIELKDHLEVNLIIHAPAARTDLNVQMKKGDFIINAINGWMEATLTEGNMNITGIDGYFSGKTQKGNITASLSGNRWNGHGLTAVTQEGDVDLTLPEKYDAMLQLDSRNGEITVDYPSREVEGELVPLEAAVQRKAQQLKVQIGDGGAPVRLGTQSGDASLRKR